MFRVGTPPPHFPYFSIRKKKRKKEQRETEREREREREKETGEAYVATLK